MKARYCRRQRRAARSRRAPRWLLRHADHGSVKQQHKEQWKIVLSAVGAQYPTAQRIEQRRRHAVAPRPKRPPSGAATGCGSGRIIRATAGQRAAGRAARRRRSGCVRTGDSMVRIAITQAAYDAICATLPLGSVGYENEANEKGEHLIWLELLLARQLTRSTVLSAQISCSSWHLI